MNVNFKSIQPAQATKHKQNMSFKNFYAAVDENFRDEVEKILHTEIDTMNTETKKQNPDVDENALPTILLGDIPAQMVIPGVKQIKCFTDYIKNTTSSQDDVLIDKLNKFDPMQCTVYRETEALKKSILSHSKKPSAFESLVKSSYSKKNKDIF